MDATSKFVGDHNFARFADKLQWELDPAKRKMLHSLLVEEERRLGFNLEQLDKAERRVSDGEARIARQEALIGDLRAAGHDIRKAECLLDNLIEVQEMFTTYHRLILDTVNLSRL